MEKLLKKVNFVEQHLDQLVSLLDSAPANAQKYRSQITQFIDGDLKALKQTLTGDAVGNGTSAAMDKAAAREPAKAKGRDEVMKTVSEHVNAAKGSKALCVIGEHGDEHVQMLNAHVKQRLAERQHAVLLDVSTILGSVSVQSLQTTLCTEIGNSYGVSSNSYNLAEMWQEIVSSAVRKAGSPVVVVLTEMDRLRDAELAQVVAWVCDKLATQVRVVIACDVDGPVSQKVEERRNIEFLPLPRISVEARQKIVKKLFPGSEEIAEDMARMEHAHLLTYVQEAAQSLSAASGDKASVVRSMPGTLQGLYKQMLNDVESSLGFEVVGAALGLLMMSGSGLTTAELSSLLSKHTFKSGSADSATASTLVGKLSAMLVCGAADELKIKSWFMLGELRARYRIKKQDETKYHKELGAFFAEATTSGKGSSRTAVAAVYHLAAVSDWASSLPLLESLATKSLCCAEAAIEVLSSLQASFSVDAVRAVSQLVACCSLDGLSEDLAKQHLSGNGTALAVMGTGVPLKLSAAPFRNAVMLHSGINKGTFRETHTALSELCTDSPVASAYHGMMAKGADDESVAAFKAALSDTEKEILTRQGDELVLSPLRILKFDEAHVAKLQASFGIPARLSPNAVFQITGDGMGQVIGASSVLGNVQTVAALAQTIAQSTNVAALKLANMGLTDQGMTCLADGLAGNNSLTALNLSSNPFGVQGINALGRRLKPHIKHIIMDDQLGGSGPKQHVRLIDVPPHLTGAGLTRELLLTTNKPINCANLNMGPQEVNMLLGYIRVNPGITEVTVSKHPLPLGMLRGSEKAKEIKISNVKLNPGDAMIMGNMLKYNGTIQDLQLGYDNLGAQGATTLAEGIKECQSLNKLVLNNNSIGNAGAAAILEALKGSKMKELWLSFNSIDDEGMKTLAPLLPGLPNLADLRLGANKIGEDGAAALAAVLGDCTAMTDLWLGGNKLGANGKTALNDKKPEKLHMHF